MEDEKSHFIGHRYDPTDVSHIHTAAAAHSDARQLAVKRIGVILCSSSHTFLLLWVRTQTDKTAAIAIRDKNERQLFEVLRFIITPTKYYHEAIEEHFENPKTYESRGPCLDNCSFCTNAHIDFSGRISKQQLIAALQVRIFSNGAVSANKLVSLLTDKRRSYSLLMNV
eukprot:scaffold194423_cov63-Cyclotella_meneghiniana.AAC.1